MIPLLLILVVFICVASIFFPALRQLAKAILLTLLVIAGGLTALVMVVSH